MINEITTFLRSINLGFISFNLMIVFIVYSIGFLYKKYLDIYCQLSVLPFISEELHKSAKQCEQLREAYMKLEYQIRGIRSDLDKFDDFKKEYIKQKIEQLKKDKDNASADKS